LKPEWPAEAVHHLREALRLEPGIVEALVWLSITYLSAGRAEWATPYVQELLQNVQELLQIDALTPSHHSLLRYWHLIRGENSDAEAAYRRMFEMDSGNPLTVVLYGRMLVLLGEEEKALDTLERISGAAPENPLVGHGRVLIELLRGREGHAAAAITPALEEASRYDEHLSWWMGDWFAALGEEGKSVDWLQHAVDLGFFNRPVLDGIDSFLDPIRKSPVFRDFLAGVRAKWEAFED